MELMAQQLSDRCDGLVNFSFYLCHGMFPTRFLGTASTSHYDPKADSPLDGWLSGGVGGAGSGCDGANGEDREDI